MMIWFLFLLFSYGLDASDQAVAGITSGMRKIYISGRMQSLSLQDFDWYALCILGYEIPRKNVYNSVYAHIDTIADVVEATRDVNNGYLPLHRIAKTALVDNFMELFSDQDQAVQACVAIAEKFTLYPTSVAAVIDEIKLRYCHLQANRQALQNLSLAARKRTHKIFS